MSFIFLIAVIFTGLFIVGYLEDPETEQNRNINRLVRESLKNDRIRNRRTRRIYY